MRPQIRLFGHDLDYDEYAELLAGPYLHNLSPLATLDRACLERFGGGDPLRHARARISAARTRVARVLGEKLPSERVPGQRVDLSGPRRGRLQLRERNRLDRNVKEIEANSAAIAAMAPLWVGCHSLRRSMRIHHLLAKHGRKLGVVNVLEVFTAAAILHAWSQSPPERDTVPSRCLPTPPERWPHDSRALGPTWFDEDRFDEDRFDEDPDAFESPLPELV